MVLAGLAVMLAGRAHASVNLPLHHWAYEAIERLTALGVIDRAMVVPKPYSRKQAAKYVARAIERVKADEIPMDGRETIAEPLLERLMQEFKPELVGLGAIARPRGMELRPIRYGARATTEFDAFFVGGGQTFRLRENRAGEYYVNAEQNQTDVRGWFEVSDWAAVVVQPKFLSSPKALSLGPTTGPLTNLNGQYLYLRELSLKLSYFNIALEVGRGTQWWGPGYHGSLLLTDHAFPLDMIKLGSDEPFRLPWILRSLGEWKVNTFLARLEENRDFPRAEVFGLRISYLPTSWLELGFTRLTQFDGRGRGQSFPSTVAGCYGNPPNQTGTADCNEQAMVDARARIPHIPYVLPFPAGVQLYGELGSEDKWSKIPLPSRAAFLTGIYIPQVFRGDSMDLRIEYADTDFTRRKTSDHLPEVWYNNGVYVSGMRYRGFPLGHHMGTDGIDFFIRTTRYLTEKVQLGTNFNLQERDRGQPVHERKQEAAFDLTWWVSSKVQFTVGYTYQRLKNPGQITSINPFIETFAPGITASNNFLWTSLVVEF